MMEIPVGKWGNSNAIRLPMEMLKAIGAKQGDKLSVEVENGKIVLEKKQIKEKLTIAKLFEDYNGESFDSEVVEFKPMGNELW